MNILLTGATGFLGGKLIKNIINESNHTVYVIARNMKKAEALRESFTPQEQERIQFIEGDITSPYSGLSKEKMDELKGSIDIVYHLAALVKFDQDLRDELFSVNYDGTKHVLDLASYCEVKKFYYVSTAYTVGKNPIGKEDLYPTEGPFNNPYEESKVKSEHLVFSYRDKMDVSIFRPAIIVGDSKTGEADSHFTLYGFMRALDLFKRKTLRKKDADGTFYRVIASKEGTSNFVPVDYVADILGLAVSKAEPDMIYNITNPNPPTNLEILHMLKNALDFDHLSIVDDHKDYDLTPEEQRLNQMVEVFRPYLESSIKFKDDNTQKLIQGTETPHLHMTNETLQMIVNAYFDL